MTTTGSKVVIVGGHAGHQGTVRGTATSAKGRVIRLSVRCDCGADLWLKPEWLERVGVRNEEVLNQE